MKELLKEYFSHLTIRQKDIRIFSVCLLVAFLFWILNALSKEYTLTIDVPVQYVNFPEKKLISNKLPSYYTATIEGPGKDVFWMRFRSNFKPIELSIKDLMRYGKSKSKGVLKKEALYKIIGDQFGNTMTIQSIYPDLVELYFEPKLVKKVPIEVDVEYSSNLSISNSYIEVSPDSIIVSGPHSVIRAVKYWKTNMIELKENGEFEEQIGLLKPDDNKLSLNVDIVDVKIKVDELVQIKKTIPVKVKNEPTGLKLYQNEIKVTYYIPMSKVDELNEKEILVGVDFEEVNIEETNQVKVQAFQFPIFVRNIQWEEDYLQFIIQQ